MELDRICMTNYSKNTQRQLDLMTGDNSTMPKGNCVVECIANQTKVYRGHGFIDRANLARLFYNAVSGDREWGAIVSSSLDICMSESKSAVCSGVVHDISIDFLSFLLVHGIECRNWFFFLSSRFDILVRVKADEFRQSATMGASFDGEVICHPISGYVFGCMNTELFKRCPNLTESNDCSALQQYSANCHISVKYMSNKISTSTSNSTWDWSEVWRIKFIHFPFLRWCSNVGKKGSVRNWNSNRRLRVEKNKVGKWKTFCFCLNNFNLEQSNEMYFLRKLDKLWRLRVARQLGESWKLFTISN